jgi:hypothetical protein
MKFIIISLALLCVMSSCFNYQYMTVNSTLPRDADKGYVIENDSLEITYKFKGQNCPVQVQIRNKAKHPIYVDWSKCALVIKDQTYSYFKNSTRLNAESTGVTTAGTPYYGGVPYSISSHSISGTLSSSPAVSFIPPDASVRNDLIELRSSTFKQIDKKRIRIQTPTRSIPVIASSYTIENSPLKFRSYLTVAHTEDMKVTSTFDHEFWIGRIIYTVERPSAILPNIENSLNTFHVTTATGGTSVGAVALVGAVAVGTALLDDQPSE